MSRTIKNALTLSASLLLGVMLVQCSKKTPAPDFSYTVAISFTPDAAAKMKTLGQKATLEAYYYGAPIEASKSNINDDGQINLGADLVDIDAANASVKMSGNGIIAERLANITDAKPMVTVTAYSAATAGTPDQLDCTHFDGALSDAQAKPVEIVCSLPKG